MNNTLKFILLSVVLLLLLVATLFFGSIHISSDTVLNILAGSASEDSPYSFIVLQARLPQGLTALITGGSLGVAGLLMQTVFRNPLAGPSVLGISSGASLGVALVTLFMGGGLSLGSVSLSGNAALIISAIVGSVSVMGILLLLSTRIKNNLMLLITGMMVGYLTSALVSLLASLSTSTGLQSFTMWGFGTFANVNLGRLPLFAIVNATGIIIAFSLTKQLNTLLLGDQYALNLGINLQRTRILLLLATGILTAVTTAYCGPIAFIGLAMPHIARMLFVTDNHFILLPATFITGSIICLGCNLLSVMPTNVIPINALTPIVGVPVIIKVLIRNN